MNSLLREYLLALVLVVHITGLNGLDWNATKEKIGDNLLGEYVRIVTDGDTATMDIDRIVGKVKFLRQKIPYTLSKVRIGDFRKATVVGTPEISDKKVTLQIQMPNVETYFHKIRVLLFFLNFNFHKTNVKNSVANFEVVLEIEEKNDKCTMLAKNIDLKLGDYDEFVIKGFPNWAIANHAKNQLLAEVPNKVTEALMKILSVPHEIPCDLF